MLSQLFRAYLSAACNRVYHCDNVERQDKVSKGLNSIRGELQYHIRRLQEVIYDLDIRQSRLTDGQHDKSANN